MKKSFIFALALLSIINCRLSIVEAQNLVPKPVSVERGEGGFAVESFLAIDFSAPELSPLADYLRGMADGGKFTLSIDSALADASGKRLPAEGYKLTVGKEVTTIVGRDYNGVWNGIQTYLQLLPAPPVVTITDYPAVSYRGVMLDVARTWVPKDAVMRIIDNLARQKINKFHWHLTDNEAWRVEIKKYPFLTSVGAFRGGGSKIFAIYGHWDEKYGGYYSKNDILEVVEFARVRGVEIIPEIDLPGHSRAAAIAYPSILCDYKPDLQASQGYDTRDVWCAAREENYEMLDGIIGELAEMFPSEYIHLGGDEVNSSQWAKCPHCQALMARHGLTDPKRLEDIFMARVIEIAARHGKKAAAWNEAAARGEIPKSTVIFGWESVAAARRAAANGYPTVVCPGEYFYFDMKQGPTDPGHTWAGIVTAEKVYSFDLENINNVRDSAVSSALEEDVSGLPAPTSTTLPTSGTVGVEATFFSELALENEPKNGYGAHEKSAQFLGVEAPLFTSVVGGNGDNFIDYQLFPRACALAELAWTPASLRSWPDFERRMGYVDANGRPADPSNPIPGTHFARLKEMGIQYRAAAPVPDPQLRTLNVTPTTSITSRRGPVEGDWYLWTFERPLVCREIFIKTGRGHLQRGGFPSGRVEVSHDGVNFTQVAELHDLKATVEPTKPIRALRVICTSHGNGEAATEVQPLVVR